MRTVYINSSEVGRKLLVAKSDNPADADVVVLHIGENSTPKSMLQSYKVAVNFGRRCYVYVDDVDTVEFYNDLVYLFATTSAQVLYGMDRLTHELVEDIKEFTSYSVEDFVTVTAENYGVDATYAKYLVVPVERHLKEHSVFVVVKTVLGMFESGEKNFTKLAERMKYFLEVFNSAQNADMVYQSKGSQCLSVLAAVKCKVSADWEKFERLTMSVMLKPYEVWEKPEERADIVARTIRESR